MIRTSTIRYLVRAFILAGFAYYISVLVENGGMMYYIAPSMEKYIKLSAFTLLAIAAFQGFLAMKSTWNTDEQAVGADCECDKEDAGHAHKYDTKGVHSEISRSIKLRSFIVYGMFMFPLLLGFLLPDAVLNSTIAEKKGINLSMLSVSKSKVPTVEQPAQSGLEQMNEPEPEPGPEPGPEAIVQVSPVAEMKSDSVAVNDGELDLAKLFIVQDEYEEPYAKLAMNLYKQDVIELSDDGFVEIITAIDLFKDSFVGKKIAYSGFVYREDGMKPEQLVIARFVMQCCSADSMPFGFISEYPHAQNFTKDTWANIKGTIGTTNYHDNKVVKIKIEQISKIDPPESPYAYANYEFLYK